MSDDGRRGSDRRTGDAGPAPIAITAAVLTAGALTSAVCLLMALVLEVLGRPTTAGDPMDVGSVLAAVAELRPWGWATVGVVMVVATPAIGLVATAVEHGGRRESLVALGVLLILAVSLSVAVLR